MTTCQRTSICAALAAALLAAWYGIEIYLCGDSQISMVDIAAALAVACWIVSNFDNKKVVWVCVFSIVMLTVKYAWFGIESVTCEYSLSSEIDCLFSSLIAIYITHSIMDGK